jgi:hypothetical protein
VSRAWRPEPQRHPVTMHERSALTDHGAPSNASTVRGGTWVFAPVG